MIGALTLTGLVVGLSSPPVRSQSQPFTPEVDEFVRTYLKGGGDKLTNWVQGDKTSPPEATRRAFKPIAGLSVDLVASEPVIRQPVDLHFDDRGRLWVVQYLQYPFPAGLTITSYRPVPARALQRDAGGATQPRPWRGQDHGARGYGWRRHVRLAQGRHHRPQHHDQRLDRARRCLGDEPAASAVLSRLDGGWSSRRRPRSSLSGFGLEDTHSLANSLTWGPDGWLYGVHGSTSTARVRGISFLGQAVWRYHPDTDAFELFAQGGGNPWTLSFDSSGRAFSGDNSGNSRGFHWVQGGRYEKNWPKHGPFTRPHSYGFIPNMDHEGDAARFAMTSVIYEDGKLPGTKGS